MNSFSVRGEAVLILVPASNRFDAREEAVRYFLSLVGDAIQLPLRCSLSPLLRSLALLTDVGGSPIRRSNKYLFVSTQLEAVGSSPRRSTR